MIIQLHTPKGIVEVDTETVSNQQLASLKISRATLMELTPRDLPAEIDGLKVELKAKGVID